MFDQILYSFTRLGSLGFDFTVKCGVVVNDEGCYHLIIGASWNQTCSYVIGYNRGY
jgi:hypothetical protein